MTTTGRAQGVRARARAEMRTEILDAARRQLADEGAVGLSLRAVAREVGMVSSAVYRYFDNRDALLTALIIDAYDSLGEAVEAAEASMPREDLAGRWGAIAGTVRTWALENPSLYALVYGSPVPGYAAPQDTVGPATRVTRLLAALLRDAPRTDAGADAGLEPPALSPDAVEGLAPLVEFLGPGTTQERAVRGLMAWTWLFGAVSFELFGQLTGAVAQERRDAVFEAEAQRAALSLGLTGGPQDAADAGRSGGPRGL
ncbi:MAG TPA: TetR/AcrR family transcriptional regulator [Ornithinibacter sp.]|nr:TetR/AcrR family transcriptional regulator [Ornithinibacter sp.]